ncbi:hypothetical protein ILYODFUR_021791 [Ilyodon furcidens]|uniref:Uncharacterized protein n=1 Tax=Ilyodon furcidens TaxID=33524 RepID=A0ABV0T1L9_9TELE
MVREEPEPGNKLQGMRHDPPGGENDNGAAYRSNMANYCHSSSSGWPVSGCLHTAGDPWGSNTGNYTSGGREIHAHTMTATDTHRVTSSFNDRLSNLISQNNH